MLSTKPRVCVLGAGVAGLTSALRLLQSLGDRLQCVDVIADKYGAETTSHGAAGLWGPYRMSDTPVSQLETLGAETYDHLMDLYHSPEAEAAGVGLVSCHDLSAGPEPVDIPWKATLLHYSQHVHNPKHFGRYRYGVSYSAPLCEGRWYLPWLTKQVEHLGVGPAERRFQTRRVAALDDLRADYDVVINCTGLGAKELLGDTDCYPIRGQIMRVHAPWVKHAYFFGSSYIIPTRDAVVLGGTGQMGDFNTSPTDEDRRCILDGVCEILPGLRTAEVLSEWAGLRPGRTQLRLELQEEAVAQGAAGDAASGGQLGGALRVVHNYGHGGGGLSLAWGCAGEVVRMVRGVV